MTVKHIIEDAYNDVALFNTLAGNLDNVTDEGIDNQISLCFEELTETIDAFEQGDMKAVLQETADLFVVVAGLMQKLEAKGYPLATVLDRVNQTNLSKFPKEITYADEKLAEKEGYCIVQNHQYSRFMLKDTNGKIRKPASFKPVDLSDIEVK